MVDSAQSRLRRLLATAQVALALAFSAFVAATVLHRNESNKRFNEKTHRHCSSPRSCCRCCASQPRLQVTTSILRILRPKSTIRFYLCKQELRLFTRDSRRGASSEIGLLLQTTRSSSME